MKKLKGELTLLINSDVTRIEIKDELSGNLIVSVEVSPENIVAALSRLANVECDMKYYGSDNIGKKRENDRYLFDVKDILYTRHNKKNLQEQCQKLLDEENQGWICRNYFNSQDSFIRKDGKTFANAYIDRYVEV